MDKDQLPARTYNGEGRRDVLTGKHGLSLRDRPYVVRAQPSFTTIADSARKSAVFASIAA
jgi:hypothetical protein